MTHSGKPQQLIHPLSVLALAAFVLGLLITLFPKESLYADPHYNNAPDLLSVAYQKVLLVARPDDPRVRLSLATQLRKLGQIDEAGAVIAPLGMKYATLSVEQRTLFLQESLWIAQDGIARGEEVQREQLRQRMFEALEQDWTLDFLDQTTRPFLSSLSAPDRVAFLTRRLTMFDSAESAVDNLIELAAVVRANADPVFESLLLEQAWTMASASDERRQVIEARWLPASLEASPERALEVVRQLIQSYPDDLRWLDPGVEIALQNSELAWAIEWSEQARRAGDDSARRLTQLLEMTLASGDTPGAIRYLESLLAIDPESADLQGKAARMHSWIGDEIRALDHWEFVARHTGDPTAVAATWQIALNTRQPQRAIAVLRRESVRRNLTEEEWQALAESHVTLGRFDAARDTLARAVQANPRSRPLLEVWVRLAYQQRDTAAAIAGLTSMAERFGLQPEEVLLLASKYWEQGNVARAHATLTAHEHPGTVVQPEYWLLRAEMAQALNLAEDRDHSLAQLPASLTLTGERGAERLQRVVFLLNAKGAHQAAAELAEQGFAAYGEQNLLLLALENAAAARDQVRVEALLERLQAEDIAIEDNAAVWAIRAVLAESRGQVEAAGYAWSRAETLAPARNDYQLAHVWFHLDHADLFRTALQRDLQKLSRQVDPPREVVEVLAQGWHRLGNSDQAVIWFAAGLNDHHKDWQWLQAYAENLERQGETVRAAALERQTLALLTAELAERSVSGATPEDTLAAQTLFAQQLQQYLLLSHRYGQPEQARQTTLAVLHRKDDLACCVEGTLATTPVLIRAARGLGSAELDRQLTIRGMQWALEADNELDIRHYEMLAAAGDVRLPAWQQLALGAKQRDGYRVHQVLAEARDELPMADQMLALDHIGARREARVLARGVLAGEQQDNARDLTVASDILQRRGDAWQATARHDAFGPLDTNSLAARYRTLFGENPITVAVEAASIRSAKPDELKPEAGLEQRVDLQADLSLDLNGNPVALRTTLRMTDSRLLPGVAVKTGMRDSLGIDHEMTLYAGQPTELTAALSVAGQESGVRYAGGWQATATTRLSAELNWRHLADIDYDNLGRGHAITALLTQDLLTGADRLTARLAHQHGYYEGESDLSDHLRDHFTVISADDALFPSSFERTSVGISLSDGWLHQLMPVAPARRWRTLADLETGYEWQDGGWDYGVRLGAGIPLWGRDELALSLGYSESPASGETRQTALLTYSRSLETN